MEKRSCSRTWGGTTAISPAMPLRHCSSPTDVMGATFCGTATKGLGSTPSLWEPKTQSNTFMLNILDIHLNLALMNSHLWRILSSILQISLWLEVRQALWLFWNTPIPKKWKNRPFMNLSGFTQQCKREDQKMTWCPLRLLPGKRGGLLCTGMNWNTSKTRCHQNQFGS